MEVFLLLCLTFTLQPEGRGIMPQGPRAADAFYTQVLAAPCMAEDAKRPPIGVATALKTPF